MTQTFVLMMSCLWSSPDVPPALPPTPHTHIHWYLNTVVNYCQVSVRPRSHDLLLLPPSKARFLYLMYVHNLSLFLLCTLDLSLVRCYFKRRTEDVSGSPISIINKQLLILTPNSTHWIRGYHSIRYIGLNVERFLYSLGSH